MKILIFPLFSCTFPKTGFKSKVIALEEPHTKETTVNWESSAAYFYFRNLFLVKIQEKEDKKYEFRYQQIKNHNDVLKVASSLAVSTFWTN